MTESKWLETLDAFLDAIQQRLLDNQPVRAYNALTAARVAVNNRMKQAEGLKR